MIKRIEIDGFKSITHLSLDCKNLNILTGTNSSGKSSIIQSLLVYSQIITSNYNYSLNGPLVNLGLFNEVKSKFTKEKRISVTFYDENDNDFGYMINGDGINHSLNHYDLMKNKEELENFSYKKNLYYVPFDRTGVRDSYPVNTTESKFGFQCECALSYYEEQKKGNSILEKALLKDSSSPSLSSQVNYWLNEILDVRMDTERKNLSDNFVTVKYTGKDGIAHTPRNVGSGISYLISILIVCLASDKNSTIIIENPEIHLHPKAQSKLAEFLYFIAKSGRQLFIETHSDHIINSIRVGITKNISEYKIDKNLVSVNFVTFDEIDGSTCIKMNFNEDGSIQNPQPEFFDQFTIDLEKMVGL